MSNETPVQTPQVHTVTTVPPTNVPPTDTEPKKPGKFRTALRHPIVTVQRHKTAVLLATGAAAGAVSVALLSNTKVRVEIEKDEDEDEETQSNLTLLESYNDETN